MVMGGLTSFLSSKIGGNQKQETNPSFAMKPTPPPPPPPDCGHMLWSVGMTCDIASPRGFLFPLFFSNPMTFLVGALTLRIFAFVVVSRVISFTLSPGSTSIQGFKPFRSPRWPPLLSSASSAFFACLSSCSCLFSLFETSSSPYPDSRPYVVLHCCCGLGTQRDLSIYIHAEWEKAIGQRKLPCGCFWCDGHLPCTSQRFCFTGSIHSSFSAASRAPFVRFSVLSASALSVNSSIFPQSLVFLLCFLSSDVLCAIFLEQRTPFIANTLEQKEREEGRKEGRRGGKRSASCVPCEQRG